MKGINKVILVGTLGKDVETRTFPEGGMLANISLATSEKWKDKNSGQPQERTEWHNVQFNGRLAEIAAQYLKRGAKVYIEGSIRTRSWEDKKTGQKRYATDVIAREMQMLDSFQAAPGHHQPQQQGFVDHTRGAVQATHSSQQNVQAPPADDDFNDDIPF